MKGTGIVIFTALHIVFIGNLVAQPYGGKDCAEAEQLANRIDSLPFIAPAEMTCGMADNYTRFNTVFCEGADTASLNGEDKVYVFTAADNGLISITFTTASADTNAGIFIFKGCPDTGPCVIGNTNASPVKFLGFDVVAGETYYILIDGGSYNILTGTTCLTNYQLSISKPQANCTTVIPPTENLQPHIGFEAGNVSLSHWEGYTGDCCPISIMSNGMVAGRFTLMNDPAGLDPYVGIPILAPAGGNYSLRLGNDQAGAQAERIRYKFKVTEQSNGIIYHYAFVLEDPGHDAFVQPRFEASLFDNNEVRLPCTYYKAVAGSAIPCSKSKGLGNQGVIVYKDWTSVAVDLSEYMDDSIYIDFATGDCGEGGHFGYAYVDVSLTKFAIDVAFCEGDSVIVLTAPSGFKSYAWSTGETSQAIQVKNPVEGTEYSVALTPFNNDTCVTVLKTTLDAWPGPTAAFSAKNVCEGDSVYFADSSFVENTVLINKWEWDFGDGTVSADPYDQHPVHFYDSAGIYTVTLSVTTNKGCTDAVIRIIEVGSYPEAAFIASSPCLNDSVQFSDNSQVKVGSIESWHWDFGDGYTSDQKAPKHQYASGGMYAVSLKVISNSGCADSIMQDVTVQPPPNAGYVFSSGCASDTVRFNDQSVESMAPLDSWHWDFGDGATANVKNPTHVYASGGNYTVKLTVTDQAGCRDTLSQAVSVYPAPLANFSAPRVCLLDPVPFSDSSASAASAINAWHWDFGDSTTSNEQNPLHLYATPGTYAVKLHVTDMQGCKGTIQKSILVDEPLTIYMSQDTTIERGSTAEVSGWANGGSGQYNYVWGPSVGAGSGPHEVKPDQSTVYNLQVSDMQGPCPAVSGSVRVNVTGTEPPDECEQAFMRIPNAFSPNADGINDTWQIPYKCLQTWNMRIYNRWGELISELTEKNEYGWNGGWKNDLDKKSPAGAYVYILNYTDKKGNPEKQVGAVIISY